MMTKHSILLFPYFLMIVVGLMIPSDGEHGILSLKSLAFISANLFVGGYAFLRQKINFYQFKLLVFMCAAITFLMGWFFVSLLRDETTGGARIDQFKLFFITLVVPFLTLYLASEKILSPQNYFKAVIYASFAYITTKVILVLLHLLGWVDIWSLMKSTGILFMRMSIFGGLDRVQTSVDISTPFIVFFVLQSNHLKINLSPFFKGCYLLLSLFSTFLSFSRYLLFVYFLSCFLYWLSLDVRGLVKGLMLFILFCGAGYLAIGPETIDKVIERRVFSRENSESDETRTLQIQALLEQFKKTPFFGTGMGGYAPELIREPNMLHLYEVQWIAFLMQFGIFGVTILLSPLVYMAVRLVGVSFSRVRYSFLGVFALWVLSGFTNPFLISLASGIIYSIFYLSGDLIIEQKEKLICN